MQWVVIIFSLIALNACQKSTGEMPAATPRKIPITIVDAPNDAKGDTGLWPNLIIDTQGKVHIVYCDGYLGDVKIAHFNTNTFQIETVEKKGAVGKYVSAILGPRGIEMVYLDQTRKMLRYASEEKSGWHFQDVTNDIEEIGISGRLILSAQNERMFVYYNTRNELMLSSGIPQANTADLLWQTRSLVHAGGFSNIRFGSRINQDGTIDLAFTDWRVSSATLFTAKLNAQEIASPQVIDDDDVAGLANELLPANTDYDILYLASHHGLLYGSKKDPSGKRKRELLANNVSNFSAIASKDGRLIVALQTGRAEGLGAGDLEIAILQNHQWNRYVIDDARPGGQYISMAQSPGSTTSNTIHVAYYDGLHHTLKYFSLSR